MTSVCDLCRNLQPTGGFVAASCLYNWSNVSEGRRGEEGGSEGGRDRNAAQVFLSVYIILMPAR